MPNYPQRRSVLSPQQPQLPDALRSTNPQVLQGQLSQGVKFGSQAMNNAPQADPWAQIAAQPTGMPAGLRLGNPIVPGAQAYAQRTHQARMGTPPPTLAGMQRLMEPDFQHTPSMFAPDDIMQRAIAGGNPIALQYANQWQPGLMNRLLQ